MKEFLLHSRNDFKLVFRDPMLKNLLFAPFIVLALLYWVVPLINARYPIFAEYNHVLMMGALMQAGTLFGFLNGFMFLEEKDENVFMVLRTVPISGRAFLLYRLSLGTGLAVLYNFLIIYTPGLIPIKPLEALLIAFQTALLVPILALSLVNFAQNKVEGFAHFKIYNLMLDLPLLVYFVPFPALHALGILPSYWSFRSIEMIAKGESMYFYYGIGLVVYAVFIGVLGWRFERKIF